MNLIKAFIIIALFATISNSIQAQTKKSISAVADVQPKVETPTTTQTTTNPTKSPHGHLLMKEIPAQKQPASKTEVNKGVAKGGIRGTEIIGEGEYLNYDKTIMQKSITGQIPVGFPKHIKGQTKEQYIQIMKDWSRNNIQQVKEEYRNEINKIIVSNNFPKYIDTGNKEYDNNIYKAKKEEWIKNHPEEYNKLKGNGQMSEEDMNTKKIKEQTR